MSRSDKGDGLPSGAGCEQREQTEGLKVTHVLFKFHITPRNPSGLPCGNPPPFSREAKSGSRGKYPVNRFANAMFFIRTLI